MTDNKLLEATKSLVDINHQIELLKKEASELETSIKDEMTSRNVESINLLGYIIRWTAFTSMRFDSKRFKNEQGEKLYEQYCNPVQSKRFSIN